MFLNFGLRHLTSKEGTESPRHSSLREAIKVEKIENEWKVPFQGGWGSQDYFHSTVEGGGSKYEMEISIHFIFSTLKASLSFFTFFTSQVPFSKIFNP